ncbi:MAG: hypothetical protein OQK93_07485 [Gammaproteobacteria bacterium]|jgi:hypothetical protein|nr:hypothetical protein [Gammaproteobacteria bacterium]
MVKYGELDKALATFVCGDTLDLIPAEYYRRVIKTAIRVNNEGKQWDMQQAAAVLLYFAFNDGLLSPSQLTSDGLKALDYAEMFMEVSQTTIDLVEEMNRHSA